MQKLNQSPTMINDNSESNNKPTNKQKNIKITQKCVGGNTLYQFCVNKQCQQKDKFLCNDDQCNCYQHHEECISKANIKTVLKKISQKISKNKQNVIQLKTQLIQMFTTLINKISENEQKILKEVQNHCNFMDVGELQKKFYQFFIEEKQQNFKELDQQNLSRLFQIVNQNSNNHKKTDQLFNWNQKISIFENMCKQSIQMALKHYQISFNFIKQKIIYKKINQKDKFYNEKLSLLSSKIIKNQWQLYKLINFFDKRVKSLNLVFRASQNEFDIKKYYQKCGHLQNTIILCQSKYNKIFGGYTPLTFNPVNHNQDQCALDSTGSSFLFSLTNNHKFELKQNKSAIYRSKDKQRIAFGYSSTFIIKNKANNNNCYFYLRYKIYVNQNYSENEQTYLKLTGNINQDYKVKEWEVLQVQFQ